ncbi:hypothetical protein [Candidatus Laterigemmans baculatus]|uniref:hypothetical protein n=1 Tax=Candidatus Laterigemmans baculatus TaxID=2770505 RepID=UPI0013DA6F2D|nr:hypothetical protein [Candidatus Laterigemmans baculatus]
MSEAQTFNPEFDTVFRALSERLHRFTSSDQCGRWNSAVVDDLVRDSTFLRAAEQIHEVAIRTCFPRIPPVTDGVGVLGVGIKLGESIWVDCQLWLLAGEAGRHSHSASPSRFTVSRTSGNRDDYNASFGCGLREVNGQFLYPQTDNNNGRLDRPPKTPEGWAFWYTRTYGDSSLSDWLMSRRRQRK